MKRRKLLYNMAKIGVLHPKADPDCPTCHGRGWAVFTRANAGEYPEHEGKLTVQKCDECGALPFDEDAALLAIAAGVACDKEYPCVLAKQPRCQKRRTPEPKKLRPSTYPPHSLSDYE